MRKILAQLHRDASGSAAVEAAFALPVLFAFGFGIVETGRAMWIQNSLKYAVEAAARCAAIDTINCNTDTKIQTVAKNAAAGLTVPSTSYVVDGTAACGKKVSVAYTFNGGIPGLRSFAPVLYASACYPV